VGLWTLSWPRYHGRRGEEYGGPLLASLSQERRERGPPLFPSSLLPGITRRREGPSRPMALPPPSQSRHNEEKRALPSSSSLLSSSHPGTIHPVRDFPSCISVSGQLPTPCALRSSDVHPIFSLFFPNSSCGPGYSPHVSSFSSSFP